MPKRPNQLNHFQYFLRGADAVKSTASATALGMSRHGSYLRKSNYSAGTLQLGFAVLTIVGLIGRIIEDPTRLKTNAVGILLRTGIVLIDIASGALILSDPEEKTPRAFIGKSLMICSIFASRLAGEDGHHDEDNANENKDEENPLVAAQKSEVKRYGAV